MNVSIELINGNILAKIEIMRQIMAAFDIASDDLDKLETDYLLESCALLTRHFRSKDLSITPVFMRTIYTMAISNRLATIREKSEKAVAKKTSKRNVFAKYDDICIYSLNTGIRDYECSCGAKIQITKNITIVSCIVCGQVYFSKDLNCEDSAEKSVKSSIQKALKHYYLCLNRIQANEAKDIPASVLEKLKKSLINNGYKKHESITYEIIRQHLRSIKEPEYYNNAPLLRAQITHVYPPPLTEYEKDRALTLFIAFVRAFYIVKTPEKSNIPYYYYFIYKILDHILPNTKRKKDIMACIHLQSAETIISNDILLMSMCNHIDKKLYVYRPTR